LRRTERLPEGQQKFLESRIMFPKQVAKIQGADTMWTIWTYVGETDKTWLTEAEAREVLRSYPAASAYALDDSGNYIEVEALTNDLQS
jgi:hypothetical protein